MIYRVISIAATALLTTLTSAAVAQQPSFPLNPTGRELVYYYDARGNRILDFSHCGYRNSDVPIPNANIAIRVPLVEGDNSERIQRAVDYVATLPQSADGLRGAVLLEQGTYTIDKPIRITASGIVLRGSGTESTTLLKRGVDRGAVVYIEGVNDYRTIDSTDIVSNYVPVNSCGMRVASSANLKAGTRVSLLRPSTAKWIKTMRCADFGGGIEVLGWKPGDADLLWDRTITEVIGDSIIIDAPLTAALDKTHGDGVLMRYEWPGRISECGVENMRIAAECDTTENPMDENHAWTGVSIDCAENCWVRKTDFEGLAGSAVIILHNGSNITVEDCISRNPVSEIAGMRRRTFHTMGQHTLFQRCMSEHGINDFAAGTNAAGPNAFVQCEAADAHGFSGSTGTWACGLLFDVVDIDGHDLRFGNLRSEKNGAGWNTGNSLFWQCTAAGIECASPTSDARNRAYACWAQFTGDGDWDRSNSFTSPRSIFGQQLEERLGKSVSKRMRILPRSTQASSSPTVEEAMRLTEENAEPRLTLRDWIRRAPFAGEVATIGIKSIDELPAPRPAKNIPARQYAVTDGRLTVDGALLTGIQDEVQWWNGTLRQRHIKEATPHVTRFVPDMEGTGLTDRIDSVVVWMRDNGILALDHNYGLWYDRRRDDHERVRRRDADVWAPFYEQPFARSGQSSAWDGMSRYDLTKYNKWYWMRLREFADKAAPEGLLLYNQHYFQHNIIEAGAHWVDCPWRTTNNINETGFPEPVNYAGDKRVFMAEMFYDIDHPVRRELHRKFIRQCLDNFRGQQNVIHFTSSEYTGPMEFVQFWLDCVGEWEAETGERPLIALSTTKDVQDAILADPVRSKLVDIIDIRYWHYREDGSLYAPEGGKNLAPRQHARKLPAGYTNGNSIYKAVSEYRAKFPDKAVMFYSGFFERYGWEILLAGGSSATVPVRDEAFRRAAASMSATSDSDGCKRMTGDKGAIMRFDESGAHDVELPAGRYAIRAVNPRSGEVRTLVKSIRVRGSYALNSEGGTIHWFEKL